MKNVFILLLLAFTLCLSSPLTHHAWANGGEHGGGEGKEGEKEEPKGPQFISIAPMSIPIIKNGKVVQSLFLVIALEVENNEKAEAVNAYMPLLRDAYLSGLYGTLQDRGQGTNLVDMNFVRAKLEEANNKVLPPETVKSILIQQLEQKRP